MADRYLRIRSDDGSRVLFELTDEGHVMSVETLADAVAVIDVLARSCGGFYKAAKGTPQQLAAEIKALRERVAELEGA